MLGTAAEGFLPAASRQHRGGGVAVQYLMSQPPGG